ncbi:hypothetical protein [Evansella tamaricis]|uniref:Uncharacterized protein n=1 Tax=Evansella tamaricis TaxID=2069301 RepID=A0ABS6JGY1_9BACI|nr:hypothetical protein [Evansella tamaricis]MBU9712903.1 hypothetical protein [Evansella tamaricis]
MKKWVSAIILVAIIGYVGYYFAQNVLGNTDGMMTYLEDTEELTNDYLGLIEQEALIDSEDVLYEFTENILLPGLRDILERSKEIGAQIDKDQLKEVHELHNRAIDLHIKAEEAWLAGEEPDSYYEESDALYLQYEEELDALAKKWGVEIEWLE